MKLNKTASVLAFIIGAMAIVAGGQVVFFNGTKEYTVIEWLPAHNLIIGVVTVVVTAVLLWKKSKYGLTAVIATLSMHSITMLVLLTAYTGIVAIDSLVATTVRIVIWAIILTLMLVQRSRAKNDGGKE